MSGKLTENFRELIELRWSDFVARESDQSGTNFDAIVTALARACSKGDLRAIRTSLDRLDGKIATEIEVEYPKFYMLYPYATGVVGGEVAPKQLKDPAPAPKLVEEEDEELPTGSLRVVLDRMLSSPKQVVADILASAKAVDNGLMEHGNPYVKSVIVAGLMSLVHKGQMGAVFEVFEQIDGKVAEKYKMLGDDVYITSFATTAPAGAIKNENGVYQLMSENITNAWVARLEASNGTNKRNR